MNSLVDHNTVSFLAGINRNTKMGLLIPSLVYTFVECGKYFIITLKTGNKIKGRIL